MAETKAKIGLNTKVSVADVVESPATPTWIPVGEPIDIDGPSITIATVDATHMQSPEGYAETLPTVKNLGPCTFPINSVPSDPGQQKLKVSMDSFPPTPLMFKIEYPTGEAYIFKGVPTVSPTSPVLGVRRDNVSVQPQGAITREVAP